MFIDGGVKSAARNGLFASEKAQLLPDSPNRPSTIHSRRTGEHPHTLSMPHYERHNRENPKKALPAASINQNLTQTRMH